VARSTRGSEEPNQARAVVSVIEGTPVRGALVLPSPIAAQLKASPQTIAEGYDDVTVLFADIVGFTRMSAAADPCDVVELLNEIYSRFDSLIGKHGVEKIRTIGDNYMVVSGVPCPRPDHAQALAHMALEMNDYVCRHPGIRNKPIQFRIGINSGPVIGGVIGRKKFVYDVWGDAVNIASRMESHGLPSKVHISSATYELIQDEFVCEPRGKIQIKSKGEMETWLLVGGKRHG